MSSVAARRTRPWDPLAHKFANDDERRRFFSKLGAKAHRDRLVLGGDDVEGLVLATGFKHAESLSRAVHRATRRPSGGPRSDSPPPSSLRRGPDAGDPRDPSGDRGGSGDGSVLARPRGDVQRQSSVRRRCPQAGAGSDRRIVLAQWRPGRSKDAARTSAPHDACT
jgi:hypothetical protein